MPVLTATHHRQFLDSGYVLLRGLIPQEAVDAAVAALESSPQARDCIPGERPVFHYDIPEVERCIPLGTLQCAISELAGPDAPLSTPPKLVYIPRAHTDTPNSQKRWHIDLVTPMLTPDLWAVNTFVFLTRVRAGGGAFHFVPGSPRRLRAAMLRDSIGFSFRADGAEASQDQPDGIEFLAEPGDVLLYSYLLSHDASANLTDAQTRHAFGGGTWGPLSRLDLRGKPVDAMSTLEKANSTRYQRTVDPAIPDYAPADDGPRSPQLAGRLRSHATLRLGGRVRIVAVDDARPNVVRQFSSTNWADWQEEAPLELESGASIARVDLEDRAERMLLVSVIDAGGNHSVRRFVEEDGLARWREDAPAIDGALSAESAFAHPVYGSREAYGVADFFVTAADPSRLRWTCEMIGLGGEKRHGVVAEVGGGRRIVDFLLKPGFPSQHCLVAELEEPDGRRGLWYAHSPTIDAFDEALQPLTVDGEAVRGLRLHERARGYWLVSYIGDDSAIRWGAIDWEEQRPRLRALNTADALRDALGIVGLI
jgi:hypothetical protein